MSFEDFVNGLASTAAASMRHNAGLPTTARMVRQSFDPGRAVSVDHVARNVGNLMSGSIPRFDEAPVRDHPYYTGIAAFTGRQVNHGTPLAGPLVVEDEDGVRRFSPFNTAMLASWGVGGPVINSAKSALPSALRWIPRFGKPATVAEETGPRLLGAGKEPLLLERGPIVPPPPRPYVEPEYPPIQDWMFPKNKWPPKDEWKNVNVNPLDSHWWMQPRG